MKAELATSDIIPSWIELAREVEPLFERAMAEDKDFHEFMKRKIAQDEAFMVRDEYHANDLMGLIAISHTNNAISWLAVFEKHRGKGAGNKLLERAIKDLDNKKEIRVITFRESQKEGLPARRLYHKFGFRDFDANAIHDGLPRCIMERPPQT